jgi:hypothetical protein
MWIGYRPLISSIIWQTPQDWPYISRWMTDDEVWLRCQHEGGTRLADGLERWLKKPARL